MDIKEWYKEIEKHDNYELKRYLKVKLSFKTRLLVHLEMLKRRIMKNMKGIKVH